jgi:adenylosuccinate synthase
MSKSVSIVVGAQWGDEGKGKWIDYLAEKADIVVRYQGGNNAGHTIYVGGQKFVLHQLPSGVFQKGLISAMAAGVVVHPHGLAAELQKIAAHATISPENLWVSARAHVITPWHVYLDGQRETQSAKPIGTTKRGIGPTYSDKASRTGLRMGQYVDDEMRLAWVNKMKDLHPEFTNLCDSPEWADFHKASTVLKPFVCDVETKLRNSAKAGKRLLLEGAQGTLLDLDHGTYPFVTSSSTAAAGACASLGMPAQFVSQVIGIGKAYTTRVGSGPFPTELHDKAGQTIAEKGQEFGATTGRPRRCGWFDAVAMRYAAAVNGFDGLILNKIDILTGLEELKICVKYKHPRLGELTDFPWDADILSDCEPIYETLPGWTKEIPKSGTLDDLPEQARAYVQALERYSGAPVIMIGTGPGRDDFIKM